MSSLFYVGAIPSTTVDTEVRHHVEETLAGGVSRDYVQARVAQKVAQRASTTYVDTQDTSYATAAYHVAQNALLVPLTAKGTAGGVATLGSDGKVPAAQVPVLGSGMLKFIGGPNTAFGGNTKTTPLKIAQWNVGPSGVQGQPLAFMNTSAQSTGGRPVLEIRIGNSATQQNYADQTLIARGYGRKYFRDYQMITALPVDPAMSQSQDGVQDSYDAATSLVVNAWLYDDMNQTVTTTNTSIASGALFFVRTVL